MNDVLERAVANGQVRNDIPARRLAEMVWAVAAEANHNSILRTGILDDAEAPGNVWEFCRSALLKHA